MRSTLETYVQVFSARPVETGRKMRELYDLGVEDFERAAHQVLCSYTPSPGMHYVLGLLASRGKLVPALCRLAEDPAFPVEALVANASSLEPGLEGRLTKELERVASHNDPQTRGSLMKLLDSCRRGSSLVPALSRLVQSADGHVSSKATLLAGRNVESQAWFNERLDDPEPRIRANAVEALWNSHYPWAGEIYERACQDPHQRVVANALVGLYLEGSLAALRQLILLAGDNDVLFRASAAWALGQIGDPRGLPALKNLLGDPPGRTTRNALAAIRRIGRLQADRRLGESGILELLQSSVDDGKWKALLTFHNPPPLASHRDTHWFVGCPEHWSCQVEVEYSESPGPIYAVLIGAQMLNFDLAHALAGRRPAIQWAPVRYAPGRAPRMAAASKPVEWTGGDILKINAAEADPPQNGSHDLEPPITFSFTAVGRFAEVAWKGGANPMTSASALVSIIRSAVPALKRVNKQRHIILLATEPLDAATIDLIPELVGLCRPAGVACHVLGLQRLPAASRDAYNRLGQGVGGFRLWAESESDLIRLFRTVAAGLTMRVRLQAPAEDVVRDTVTICFQTNGRFDSIETAVAEGAAVSR